MQPLLTCFYRNGLDLPLANFPHYGTGVPLRTASELLTAFCRAPALRAVVLAEVNPSYEPTRNHAWALHKSGRGCAQRRAGRHR